MNPRVQAFAHAARGIREFVAGCTHAKIQLLAAASIVIAGSLLEFQPWEWIAVVLCIGLVLSMEAMNSALEELANEVSEERRERIRKAKDMASGAVLIASLASLVIAVILIGRRF